MLEPLLVPWKGKGLEVSNPFFGVEFGTDKLEQVLATTNGDCICDWCQCHGLYCLWVLARKPATPVQLAS